ncbi:cyclic nucleotide-binding domain protein (macronuclear) [Tetrahymena thermophila SB210]|uniref:Cyclic nucleotide-binding domain protein n=1 Tax=Tetrahymena thermophila (strain SB210) TaxID=312017 RepID=W7XI98_TETTS|nr:cyclic nucleotide-binding domain protein [Tetrahymena thermophila SB210]EWS74441.1 cyclic nucleotide-binding domain protein [Tetrahymena thermophila SB210]|eukprot:XP_012653018.1 cyclic nucleotide-binding domain protein [Tetrahymena thermophila SB210]
MCFKNDEFDFSEYEKNNEVQLYNKECYFNQPENQLKQPDLQQIEESQQEIDLRSLNSMVSPKINQDLTKFQNCNEETIEYIKKNSIPLNLRDRRLSQSKLYAKSVKSSCIDKEFNRQYTTKSIIKPMRSFSSLNQISFNYLESQNRKFYEKIRNKIKYFYLNATLSGRTKLINLKIRNQINDLSDFIPENLNIASFYSFSRSQVQNYEIVGNRKGIIQIYLRYSVFFDIFPILFLFFNQEDTVSTLKIIFQIAVFLKIKNILQDISYIQSQFCMMLKRYYIIQVVNLVLKLFLIGHTIACFWYILCKVEYENYQKESGWINNQMLQDKEWWQFYIFSLYWALTLMTTGSSIASTTFETCYTVFIMLFITIIFGYILNVIGQILSEIEEKDQNRRRDVNILNDYMRKKNISKLLQSKVNLNLEYYYQQDFKQLQENYEQVLGKISLDLKNSLLKEYNKQIINKIEVLAKKFSQNSLDKLSITLQEEYYFPNQAIFNQHDLSSNCIIYVVSGQVEISSSNNTSEQTKVLLNSGQFYGLIEFFTGVSNNLHIYSKQFSQVIFIDRNKFIEIIKQNEKDFQEFHQLKDQILLYGQFDKVKLICSVCKMKTHLKQACHLVHFNKSLFYRKLGYPIGQKQDRAIFNRKKEYKQQFFALKSQQQKEEFFKYAKTFKNLDESYNSSHNFEYSFLTQSQQENEESSTIQNNNSVFFGNNEGRNNTFKSQNHVSDQKTKKTISSSTCLSKIENDLNPQIIEERNKKQKLSLKIITELNDNHMDKNHLKRESSDQDITKQEVQRISRQSLDSQHNQQILDLGKNYIYDNDIGFSNDQRIRALNIQKTILINSSKYIQSYLEDLNKFLFQRGRSLKQVKPVLEESQLQNNLFEQENNPWLFESLENFKYYFTKGNSYNVLKKVMKQRRKSRILYKRNLKSENKLIK